MFAFGLMLASHAGVAADQPQSSDSPGLRASQTLTPKKAPDEAERALLRLEARVGQTLYDDRAVISDLLSRLNRMATTVAEVHKLLTAMPASRPCKPVSVPCPTAPTATPGGFIDDLADPWLPLLGAAAILGLIGLWLTRRRKQQPELADMSVMPVSAPARAAKEPLQAVLKPVAPAPSKPAANKPPAVAPKAASPVPAVPAKAAPLAPGPKQQAAVPAPPPVGAEGSAKPDGEASLSLELAEVMLSMGLTDGAAQTLTDHIRQHPRQALFHWLKLLDIYRQSGMKAEFDKAAEELQRHFNVAPPEWQDARPSTGAKVESLEDYPHISSRIQELWPRRSCVEYLHRLLEDNRGGTRAGFPQPVVEEVLLLLSLIKD